MSRNRKSLDNRRFEKRCFGYLPALKYHVAALDEGSDVAESKAFKEPTKFHNGHFVLAADVDPRKRPT
jgi:hypothetical protein